MWNMRNNVKGELTKVGYYEKAFHNFQDALNLELNLIYIDFNSKKLNEMHRKINILYSEGIKQIIEYSIMLKYQNRFKESLEVLEISLTLASLMLDSELKEQTINIIIRLIKTAKIENIRNTIFKLGTIYVRLQVRDIAEMCGERSELIVPIILEMIEKYQIHAKYSKNTKSISFDINSNMDILDKLDNLYEELEAEGCLKKIHKE